MRRLGLGLLAGALGLSALIGLGIAEPDVARAAPRDPVRATPAAVRPATTRPTRVSLYGDSLAYQSRASFATRMRELAPGDLTVSALPGAALCDMRDSVIQDLVRRRPQVLALEFSGNSFTACMSATTGTLLTIGSPGWRARYLDDLRTVLTVAAFTGTSVLWETAPPVHHAMSPTNYPRVLAAAIRKLAATDTHLRVADAGAAVAGDHQSFTRSQPCRRSESAFCHDGRVTTRADDGLHFDCHGAVDGFDCTGYSAGGRRFGEAMADAIIGTAAAPSD